MFIPRHIGTRAYQLQYPVPGVFVSVRGTHTTSDSHLVPTHMQHISFSYKIYQQCCALTKYKAIRSLVR